MNRLSSVYLLILDDFGLRLTSPSGGDDLHEIILRREEHGSILLTNNRALSGWEKLFGRSLFASVALDRLTHHARIAAITGENQRQRQRREVVSPAPST